MDRPQRIIVIAGAHSKVGKTTLCSILLRELQGYGAIKFTKDLFGSPLIDSDEIILQKGKDTAIMAESGARKVVLVSGHGKRFKEALYSALRMMSSLRGVIIEGNYPLEFLVPDLLIFVIGPDKEIKQPAMKIVKMADIVVINSEGDDRDTGFLSELLNRKAKVFFVNLKMNGLDTNKFLSYVKEII